MLTNVHLKNLALIKEADIDYGKGLNIMTGETGSGKSIIISSINIALGDKANKSLIRSGCESGLIELTFVTDDPGVHSKLRELGITEDGNNITVTRKITKDAGISKINGETLTLANLRKITSMLVDIHGQHDHQSLLNPANHIEILDQFGGSGLLLKKEKFKNSYEEYRKLKMEFRSMNMDEEALKREISLLEYEHKEIEEAQILPGEDARLEAEYKRLEANEKMAGSLSSALFALNDEEKGAISRIAKAAAELKFATQTDPDNADLKTFIGTLTDLDSVTRDLDHDLEKYIESHQFDHERFSAVRERLDLINRLRSKYGNSAEEILDFDENIQKELKRYTEHLNNREKINNRMSRQRAELNRDALELSKARKETAVRLSEMISKNLKELNFLNVDFRIGFSKADKIGEKGFDRVEFLISLNPGEEVKPLAKVASGGELSRIMLAIKCSIAEHDSIPTLIFDEIDTGISGRTAQMVALKLKSLAASHQIVCITHLPQIAAMADIHFGIRKEVEDGTTISGIEMLSEERQIEELAGLLSGDNITAASIENAKELKKSASK